jgi:DNA-binding protein HU-beta
MNKQDFIDEVAGKTGLSKKASGDAVDAILDVITATLKSGDSIAFTGFGKFSVSNRAARTGVNPRNPSEKVQIAASRVPKFTPGSQLKAAVK